MKKYNYGVGQMRAQRLACIFYLCLILFYQLQTLGMKSMGEGSDSNDDSKTEVIKVADLPLELQVLFLENLIYVSQNFKDAIKNLYTCSLVNKEFYSCVKYIFSNLFKKKQRIIYFIENKDSILFVLSNYNLFNRLKESYLEFLNSEKRIEEIFNNNASDKSIDFLKQLIVKQISANDQTNGLVCKSDFDKLASSLIKIYVNFLTLIIKSNLDRKCKTVLANKFFDVIYRTVESFKKSSLIDKDFFDNQLYNCFDSDLKYANKNTNVTTLLSLHIILELFKSDHEVIFASISRDSHLLEVLSNFFFNRNNYQELRRPPPLVLKTAEKELEEFINFCLSIDRYGDKKIFLEFLENKKEQFINWLCTREQPNVILSNCLLNDFFNVAKLLLKYITISQGDKNAIFCHAINEKCNFENPDLLSTVKLLVDFGIDVNYKDQDGTTFLMKTINKNDLDAIELLLKHQAQVDLQDNEGKTSLIRVLEQNSSRKLDMIKLLFKYGGQKTLDIQDKSGQSARQIAKKDPNLEKFV